MAQLELQNQTQFLAEEPFFEQPVARPQAEKVVVAQTPFLRRRKTVVFLILLVTIGLLLTLYFVNLWILKSRRLGTPQVVGIATPTPAATTALELEAAQLRQQLEAADPTVSQLQPPAVDPALRLDSKER